MPANHDVTRARAILALKDALLSLWIWIAVALCTVLVWVASLIAVLVSGWWDKDRRLAHTTIQCWARAIVRINPYWNLTVDDKARLKPGRAYVFVANHQSFADVVVLPHVGLPYKCLSKSELFHVPFLGWTLSLNRHIPLRRGSVPGIRRAMEDARRWLKRGMPVAFFAEGTRSKTGELAPFKSGAFKLAIQTETPVVPLVITGTHDALPRGSWIMHNRVHGKLIILPPIDSKGYPEEQCDALKERVFSVMADTVAAERELENRGATSS